MTLARSFASLLVLAAALSACGSAGDDAEVDLAADSSEGTSSSTSLLALGTDVANPTAPAATPEAMAATALANSGAVLMPAGCAVGRVQGASVTWTLTSCTGPYGLVNANGTLVATYSARTPTGFTVRVTGDLTLNRARVQPDATAIVTVAGTSRTARVTVNGHGTGPRGVAYQNSGSYTATWDGSCLGLDGSVTTSGGGASGTVTFANYRRCRGRCPAAGGAVSLSGSGGASVRIAFSGGATATATGARGRTVTVPLYCVAE